MTDGLFSRLPRFDEEASIAASLNEIQDACESEPDEAEPPEGLELSEPPLVSEAEQVGPQLEAVEAMLGRLAAAAANVEQETQARAMDLAQSLAAKLFPELSRRFLADEIARHLPELVPASAPSIEIRAEPELAGRLGEMADRIEGVDWRCSVKPLEAGEEARVDVSWGEGGVMFDFNGLLDACLARMNHSAPSNIEV